MLSRPYGIVVRQNASRKTSTKIKSLRSKDLSYIKGSARLKYAMKANCAKGRASVYWRRAGKRKENS